MGLHRTPTSRSCTATGQRGDHLKGRDQFPPATYRHWPITQAAERQLYHRGADDRIAGAEGPHEGFDYRLNVD
uniref:Uncharacterized protein n=1 Tax=Mycolicibacterium sp. CBMA 213 TaxID=1968788 RepID=A0A343VRG6_9MYCO|nr:hypothetical protein [Mycolicibacterium sp. CBMA 213]AVN58490.1 hypothetical protein B5P44_p00195 [Mycolicibacterium sp. CBMA 213]